MNKAMLKPCPFCGTEPALELTDPYGYRVRCRRCGANTSWHQARAQAIRTWNRRTKDGSTAEAVTVRVK